MLKFHRGLAKFSWYYIFPRPCFNLGTFLSGQNWRKFEFSSRREIFDLFWGLLLARILNLCLQTKTPSFITTTWRPQRFDARHSCWTNENWMSSKKVIFIFSYFYRTLVRSLVMLVTDSLTHQLTISLHLFSKLDWWDPGMCRCLLKTCWGCYCPWC